MLTSPSDFALPTVTEAAGLAGAEAPLTLVFRGGELLVDDAGGDRLQPAAADVARGFASEALVVGHWRDQTITVKRAETGTDAPAGSRWSGLRSLFGVMDDSLVAIAGRAFQIADWDRSHRFCGVCATETRRDPKERARRCPACGHTAYPRISPAMMCLVTRGREVLLARNVNFPAGRYSALAGFLEAGESIEDAVHREVEEEVGVRVTSLRYFASQSWPFPNSLMIAFTAEYAGGELRPNGHEIAEAGWFSADELPQLPPRFSIARALLDDTLQRL